MNDFRINKVLFITVLLFCLFSVVSSIAVDDLIVITKNDNNVVKIKLKEINKMLIEKSTSDIKSEFDYPSMKLMIFPNPCQENVNVKLLADEYILTLKVFNILGEIVFDLKSTGLLLDNKYVWNLTGNDGERVRTGLYFIQLTTIHNTYCDKIIIQ